MRMCAQSQELWNPDSQNPDSRPSLSLSRLTVSADIKASINVVISLAKQLIRKEGRPSIRHF